MELVYKVIAHFNKKRIACVNTGITPSPKSSHERTEDLYDMACRTKVQLITV